MGHLHVRLSPYHLHNQNQTKTKNPVQTVINPTDIGDNICQANITFSFLGDNGQITLENLTWGRSMGM